MRKQQPLVLLIHEPPMAVEALQSVFSMLEGFRVQSVTRLAAGIARIAGGGVDAVILDLSSSQHDDTEKLRGFVRLRGAAPGVPVIVLCDSEDEELLALAGRMRAFAVAKRDCATRLLTTLRGLLEEPNRSAGASGEIVKRGGGKIITFLGSKGGVGVTTIAFNVACALAKHRSVILAELHSSAGALSLHLKPPRGVSDLSSLLPGGGIVKADIQGCLWRPRAYPRMGVLFGPQRPYPEIRMDADRAKAILGALSSLADLVVVDLAPTLSESNRAVIEFSDCLTVVLEREPFGLELARELLRTVSSWESAPRCTEVVVVNRTLFATPISIEDVEARLETRILASIPPAADDCMAAQRTARPLVTFDRECLAAESLIALAKTLSGGETVLEGRELRVS